MSWRIVVISSTSKLDLKLGYLVIRNEKTTKVHLGEIHTLVIESTAVSLTAALLNEMVKRKIKIILQNGVFLVVIPSKTSSYECLVGIFWCSLFVFRSRTD